MSSEILLPAPHSRTMSPETGFKMGPHQIKVLTQPIRKSTHMEETFPYIFSPIRELRSRYKAEFYQQSLITKCGDVEKGMLGLLEGSGRVFIIPPDMNERASFNPDTVINAEIGKILSKRQNCHIPRTPKDIIHSENLLTLSANWKELFLMFYKNYPDSNLPVPDEEDFSKDNQSKPHIVFTQEGSRTSDERLSRFIEVQLNDYVYYDPTQPDLSDHNRKSCGAIDFVGFGPDGTIFIIEFSPEGVGKSKQLARQVRGLRALLSEKLPYAQLPPIIPLKGIYNADTDPKIISFMPASTTYFPIDEAIQKAERLLSSAAD